MDLCSSKRTFVQFQKWLKPSSYVHLNTSTILHLWFNYFNWQLYMQRHTWIRNLDEYRKGQEERNSGTLSFNEGDDTGRNNQDSDSAAESDNDDNADDRWWLCKYSLTVFSGFINRIADKLQQLSLSSKVKGCTLSDTVYNCIRSVCSKWKTTTCAGAQAKFVWIQGQL